MKDDQLLVLFAIVALIVSVVAAGFTYFSIANLAARISGYATSTGQANLTVESAAVINFTTNYISWGSGQVGVGQQTAQLTTLPTGNVTAGNWSLQQAGGFRIENIGNVNVSLDLAAGKSAATFLGGTSPGYQWNVSSVETNSCLNATGTGVTGLPLGTWYDVNTSGVGTRFCGVFQFIDSADVVRIDINLTVPYNSFTGALTDTLTATATAL